MYALSITFRSNERPFHTVYKPARPIADDLAAIKWARGMAETLAADYDLTLLKDGQPMAFEELAPLA